MTPKWVTSFQKKKQGGNVLPEEIANELPFSAHPRFPMGQDKRTFCFTKALKGPSSDT